MVTVLEAQTNATLTLIKEEGRQISLTRAADEVPDGEGGVMKAPRGDTILPAKLRFFGSTLRQGELIRTPEGDSFRSEHVLIGPPDDDIRSDDTFDIYNRTFVVRYVHPDTRYQTKAYVTSHASP